MQVGSYGGFQLERVTHVAQFDFFTVLTYEDVSPLQITMRHILTVKVIEGLERLLSVHTSILFANLAILFAHLCDALIDVLEVDAENVALNNLRVVILDNVSMIELLVPLYLLLYRLYLLLVKTEIGVHKFDHFHSECLTSVNVKRLVDLSCSPVSQLLSHLPLDILAIKFIAFNNFSRSHLCEKIILLLLLLKMGQNSIKLCDIFPIVHIKFFVNHLETIGRIHKSFFARRSIGTNNYSLMITTLVVHL